MKWLLIGLMGFHVNAQTADEPDVNKVTTRWNAGASLAYYRYVEPSLISQTGFLIGAWAQFDYHALFYTGVVQGDLQNGQLDYDGAICQINSNQCSDYKAKTNELIMKLAHRFSFEGSDFVRPFFGLGYRYLYDKGEGAGFYRRTGQYFYVPLGVTLLTAWSNPDGVFIFDVEYDYFLNGMIESKLSDVNRAYGDVTHQQNHGQALKISFIFEESKKVDDLRAWSYGVFAEKWSIPKSDRAELLKDGVSSGTYFYEPENFSETLGVKIGFIY